MNLPQNIKTFLKQLPLKKMNGEEVFVAIVFFLVAGKKNIKIKSKNVKSNWSKTLIGKAYNSGFAHRAQGYTDSHDKGMICLTQEGLVLINSLLEKIPVKKEIFSNNKTAKLFNERKLHSSVVFASKKLFINKHYSQSIFEVCKLLNKKVQELSKFTKDGKSLMLEVFSINNPILKINDNITQSDKDEQEGFMHLFAGTMHGIRNPKGHDLVNLKDPYRTLEYLGFISLLFKKLDELK